MARRRRQADAQRVELERRRAEATDDDAGGDCRPTLVARLRRPCWRASAVVKRGLLCGTRSTWRGSLVSSFLTPDVRHAVRASDAVRKRGALVAGIGPLPEATPEPVLGRPLGGGRCATAGIVYDSTTIRGPAGRARPAAPSYSSYTGGGKMKAPSAVRLRSDLQVASLRKAPLAVSRRKGAASSSDKTATAWLSIRELAPTTCR